MRKLTVMASTLFLLHTLEEAMFSFWQTDIFTQTVAEFLRVNPATAYWTGQAILYTFITFALLTPKIPKWSNVLLVMLMLLETEHIIAFALSRQYHPGLITGVILLAYGIYASVAIFKSKSLNYFN